MKPILIAMNIAAAAGLMLSSLQAQAGPSRAELLARHEYGQTRHHQPSRHKGAEYAQHHYANARRYAANAVRQARRLRHLGFYPDHPRWSTSFQRHFEWALRADAWKLEREARKRARTLRELRQSAHYSYGRPH